MLRCYFIVKFLFRLSLFCYKNNLGKNCLIIHYKTVEPRKWKSKIMVKIINREIVIAEIIRPTEFLKKASWNYLRIIIF